MFLCKMDRPKENIRFLDNFDITVSLDNRVDTGRQLTAIEIAVQPLVLRVSFRDIFLIKSIVNRAIEMSNRNAEVQEVPAPPLPPPPKLGASGRTVSRSDPSRRSFSHRRRSSAAALQAQVIVTKETVRPLLFGEGKEP